MHFRHRTDRTNRRPNPRADRRPAPPRRGRAAACVCAAMAALASAVMHAAADANPEPVELPITRAVMFSSGVGYFEHVGTVEDDAVVSLRFQKDQLNDVLKSMIVTDHGGGRVMGATYTSTDPLERSLKSFGIDLSDDPSLPELLRQLRGARLTVAAPDEITGAILNVETRQAEGDDGREEHVLNIVTDRGIRSLPLRSVDRFELADHDLREELNRALALLASSRNTERQTVDIRFAGEGERTVRIGYLVEAPVWKTSYRLDLEPSEDANLQGWAIVENTSDQDWRQVNLRLVSGRPISFIQDLVTPLYLERPVVEPQLFAGLSPRRHGRAVEETDRARLRRDLRREGGGGGGGFGGGGRSRAPSAPAEAMPDAMTEDIGAGVESLSEAGALGELFEFNIQHPVDMPRRRSAMVPIVNDTVTFERVSIYNESSLDQHPLNGLRVTNETSLKLPAGPVTIYDDGAYAGDAQIGHLSPGERRLVTYAVDLPVTVSSDAESTQRIARSRIVGGVLETEHVRAFEKTYRIRNTSDRTRRMLVEHPARPNRELVEPAEPLERTGDLYRFEVELDADMSTTLAVREQQPVRQTIAIGTRSIDTLEQYAASGRISDAVREALGEAIDMRRRISRIEEEIDAVADEREQIFGDQDRLRRNLESVGRDSSIGRRYIRQLDEQEDRLAELRDEVADLQARHASAKAELEDYLADLTINERW